MEFELGSITVTYPNENTGQTRKLKIRTDGEILHFDFIDPSLDAGCISLDKKEVELLSDTLKLVLKNKLID
jgi:hypothetical protein